MKLILSIGTLLMALLFSTGSKAQTYGIAQYEISNPYLQPTGSYSGTPTAGYSIPPFPWYTKLDTVVNTGVDTFKEKIPGFCKLVKFTAHVYTISGTPTTSTVTFWASSDTGRGVDFAPVTTYTLTTSGTQVYDFPVNNGSGNTYTNGWLIFHGAGTQTCSWKGSLLLRYKEYGPSLRWNAGELCRYGSRRNDMDVE